MKIIGIEIKDEIKGEIKLPIVVECISLAIERKRIPFECDYVQNEYRVYMRTAQQSLCYFIIKNERYSVNSHIKPYKWLTLEEAETIVRRAQETDVLDLAALGDYHICTQIITPTTVICNEIDSNDEEIPLVVKIAKDTPKTYGKDELDAFDMLWFDQKSEDDEDDDDDCD